MINSATAGSRTVFTTNGPVATGAGGGTALFGSSTAGNATLIANAGPGSVGPVPFGFLKVRPTTSG